MIESIDDEKSIEKKVLKPNECYLCEKPIEKEDDAKFYGGPFQMHKACIENILEDA